MCFKLYKWNWTYLSIDLKKNFRNAFWILEFSKGNHSKIKTITGWTSNDPTCLFLVYGWTAGKISKWIIWTWSKLLLKYFYHLSVSDCFCIASKQIIYVAVACGQQVKQAVTEGCVNVECMYTNNRKCNIQLNYNCAFYKDKSGHFAIHVSIYCLVAIKWFNMWSYTWLFTHAWN